MSDQHSALYETYRWHVPRGFNLAQVCCFNWATLPSHERRPALIRQSIHGQQQISFKELGSLSAQLANGLVRLGAIPGDRVAIIMGNSPLESVALMMACWAMQAIAVPLPADLPADVLLSRLRQARCQIAFVDGHAQTQALEAIARCPRIQQVVGLNVVAGNVMGWRGLIARQPSSFSSASTTPSDPALMVWPTHAPVHFPENTALLMPHQALVGNLPGFVAANRWFPEGANRLLTTLAPWQEAGLLGAILPALYFGQTVLLDETSQLLALSEATHVVSTFARLCDWTKTTSSQTGLIHTTLKSVCVFGKSITPAWRQILLARLGVAPDLALFVSGCGIVCAENNERWPGDPGACGRPVPGHHLKVVPAATDATNTVPGQLAISRVDAHGHTNPSQYVQIWLQKESSEAAAPYDIPAWFLPGLSARELPDGQMQILGRPDDLITLNTTSIAPGVIEQGLLLDPDIERVLAMPSALKKNSQPMRELWLLIQASPTVAGNDRDWQSELITKVTALILETLAVAPGELALKIGLVTTLPADDFGSPIRPIWLSRNRMAEIRFLAPNP